MYARWLTAAVSVSCRAPSKCAATCRLGARAGQAQGWWQQVVVVVVVGGGGDGGGGEQVGASAGRGRSTLAEAEALGGPKDDPEDYQQTNLCARHIPPTHARTHARTRARTNVRTHTQTQRHTRQQQRKRRA